MLNYVFLKNAFWSIWYYIKETMACVNLVHVLLQTLYNFRNYVLNFRFILVIFIDGIYFIYIRSILFFYMWISSFLNIICLNGETIESFWHLLKIIDHSYKGLFLPYTIAQALYNISWGYMSVYTTLFDDGSESVVSCGIRV